MKRCFLLLAAASVFALPAAAQLKPSPRPVCEQRCNRIDFAENPRVTQYEAKLAQIRHQKKLETDADKLKMLEADEQAEREKREEYVEKMCRHICRNNPEA